MIITALDFDSAAGALGFVDRVTPELTRLKVGNELFTRAGPALIETVQSRGFDVFLDLKYHDIPNTVAAAVASAASLGVWMVNVHVSGGARMLAAARAAVPVVSGEQGGTRLIGVTVLTSMDAADLAQLGISETPEDRVRRLAGLASQEGLDGVVCSPLEAEMVRTVGGPDFLAVTPGVRPASAEVVRGPLGADASAADDQRRVMTPQAAVAAGSSYLVIGRPVTQAADPVVALTSIAQSIRSDTESA